MIDFILSPVGLAVVVVALLVLLGGINEFIYFKKTVKNRKGLLDDIQKLINN